MAMRKKTAILFLFLIVLMVGCSSRKTYIVGDSGLLRSEQQRWLVTAIDNQSPFFCRIDGYRPLIIRPHTLIELRASRLGVVETIVHAYREMSIDQKGRPHFRHYIGSCRIAFDLDGRFIQYKGEIYGDYEAMGEWSFSRKYGYPTEWKFSPFGTAHTIDIRTNWPITNKIIELIMGY